MHEDAIGTGWVEWPLECKCCNIIVLGYKIPY